MKVSDCPDWKAIHFRDRTIMKADLKMMGPIQKHNFGGIEIEPLPDRKGHYKVKDGANNE